jgi:serine/threonine protein kinase
MINSSKTCCLADFGLALVAESQLFTTTSTGTKGSVRWMAPEIIEPRRMQGKEKTRDVYAFGCTMLEVSLSSSHH